MAYYRELLLNLINVTTKKMSNKLILPNIDKKSSFRFQIEKKKILWIGKM
jgi:hypothetical protein